MGYSAPVKLRLEQSPRHEVAWGLMQEFLENTQVLEGSHQEATSHYSHKEARLPFFQALSKIMLIGGTVWALVAKEKAFSAYFASLFCDWGWQKEFVHFWHGFLWNIWWRYDWRSKYHKNTHTGKPISLTKLDILITASLTLRMYVSCWEGE